MRYTYHFLLIALLFFAADTLAAEIDLNKNLICASTELFECSAENACSKVQPDQIKAPQFLKIDTKNKSIISIPGLIKTKIHHSKLINGRLILLGTEDTDEEHNRGMGWSLTVTGSTGNMSLTATGDSIGFVILGACMEQ